MKKIRVVAAVMKKNDMFYIFQRDKKRAFGNLWEFPGGKIEKNESLQDALKRELKEELEISTEIQQKIATISTKVNNETVIEINFFYAKILSQKIFLNEHEDYKLINKKDFSKYTFAPADMPVLKML